MSTPKKQPKKKSVMGFYIAMVVWLICSSTLHLYTIPGMLSAIVITILVTKLITGLFGRKNKQVDEEFSDFAESPADEPVRTSYGPEIDAIIADGNRAMSEMGRLYASIDNPEIKQKINELMRISDKIVQDAIHDPSDVPQIQKFLDYYLPTTIKLLNAYDRMDAQGISGDNIDHTKTSILEMLDTAIEAFKKQLDSLFANQALDIETDIEVMNTMLKREGLAGGIADDFGLR